MCHHQVRARVVTPGCLEITSHSGWSRFVRVIVASLGGVRGDGAGFTISLCSADCLILISISCKFTGKGQEFLFFFKTDQSQMSMWDSGNFQVLAAACLSVFFTVCLSCSPTERTVWCHDWGLILWSSHLSATVTVVLTSWRMRPASALSPAVVWTASSYSLRFPQKKEPKWILWSTKSANKSREVVFMIERISVDKSCSEVLDGRCGLGGFHTGCVISPQIGIWGWCSSTGLLEISHFFIPFYFTEIDIFMV